MNPLVTDAALKGLTTLFDVDSVRKYLNEQGSCVSGGEILYVRYKPGINCKVAYQFKSEDTLTGCPGPSIFYGKCSTSGSFGPLLNKTRILRKSEYSRSPDIIPFESQETIFYSMTSDAALPGLALLDSTKVMNRLLQRHIRTYDSSQWRISDCALTTEIVRYKPEHRAVIRMKTRAVNLHSNERKKVRVHWRAYADGQAPEIFRRMKYLRRSPFRNSETTTPAPLGFDPQLQVLFMETFKGQPLGHLLNSDESVNSIERTAHALSQLHMLNDTRLPQLGMSDHLGGAKEVDGLLSFLSSDLGHHSKHIAKLLCRNAPAITGNVGLVHGDFHDEQVLVGKKRLALLDFDCMHIGSRMADVGNFLAHLHIADYYGGLEKSEQLGNTFLEAYSRTSGKRIPQEQLRWWTAYSTFLLSAGPFQRFEHDWHRRIAGILGIVEGMLC